MLYNASSARLFESVESVAFLFFSPIRSESGDKLLSPTSDCTPNDGRRAAASHASRPEDSAAYNNLGTALERLGRFSEAVAEYKKALQFQPDSTEAIANLARAQAMLKARNAVARR